LDPTQLFFFWTAFSVTMRGGANTRSGLLRTWAKVSCSATEIGGSNIASTGSTGRDVEIDEKWNAKGSRGDRMNILLLFKRSFVFEHWEVRVEDAVRGELEVNAWRDGLKGK
jgi:hypothetical protein